MSVSVMKNILQKATTAVTAETDTITRPSSAITANLRLLCRVTVTANSSQKFSKKTNQNISLPQTGVPLEVKLKAVLREGAREFYNEWELWIFPKVTGLPEGVADIREGDAAPVPNTADTISQGELTFPPNAKVVLTDRLTDEMALYMRRGGNVVLFAAEGLVRPFMKVHGMNDGRYFLLKPASFPPYEEFQHGTIIRDHPIFGDFPHDSYAGLQFFNMIGNSPPIDLEPLGLHDEDPIIRMMHSYHFSRPLGCLVEKGVGSGRLVVVSMDMRKETPEGYYLLRQMCLYLQGADKAPCRKIAESALAKLIEGSNL